MKIRIIFSQAAVENKTMPIELNERVILIQDPYTITRNDWGRVIKDSNGQNITYEQYCANLQTIIQKTLNENDLKSLDTCEGITIENCIEPPNFETLHQGLAKSEIPFNSSCKIIIRNCSYGGALFVNSTLHLIKSAGKNCFFNIVLDEEDKKTRLSTHDKAKLATLTNAAFFIDEQSASLPRPFIDDQLLDHKKENKLSNPSYFFKNASIRPSKQALLLNFFSQAHQQRSDYTCGPAALKMIADYYVAMRKRYFCGAPILEKLWKKLNATSEMMLAERVKTTEEEGSDIKDISEGLNKLGFATIDTTNCFNKSEHGERMIKEQKELLWEKLKEIFSFGIPVIINLRNYEDLGHYEVAIGIDEQENIIFAEPGRALDGKLEFESIAKNDFIPRWQNMSGEHHGVLLILLPNEASVEAVKTVMNEVPYHLNGETMNENVINIRPT